MAPQSSSSYLLNPTSPFLSSSPTSAFNAKLALLTTRHWRPIDRGLSDWRVKHFMLKAGAKLGDQRVKVANEASIEAELHSGGVGEWGKVSAVLFDMDGVLCDSEEPSRMAAVHLFEEMGVSVVVDDFVPFMGTGEANFLGGVAKAKGVKNFDTDAAKKRFFEIYLNKYAKPNSGIGFPGALELITQCKSKGLKVAVASSADRVKVDANLAAAALPFAMFDAIVSADAFQNLKPAPDIFIAASKLLNVPANECLVIEDALAGVQAATAANMRCIAVTTTLSEEALKSASPSLIRNNIGNVSLGDILSGGTDGARESGEEQREEASILDTSEEKGNVLPVGGFISSRRNVLRYGSLGVALSCLYFTITNWKAMQYASPKALLNMFLGTNQPSMEQGKAESSRVKDLVKYISELENGNIATIVPEFPAKLDWLNTAPLQFRRDLKGKVVLLDFWTYCCINCMHVLPDLEFLENKYKDMPFTVLGVHSAKFDNEKDLDAIRNAVLRYNILHPVVNDRDMYMWRELGVSSWPTYAIVGPTGKVLAQLSGEGRRKILDDLVEAALVYYGGQKMLDATPIPLNLEKYNDPRLVTSPLKFPGKLAVDTLNNRLFISDSNHNRIVVTDLSGNYIIQIGASGEEGLRDGSFDDATFNRPQGLAYNPKKNVLYVADTENHALREVDFVNEMVRTLSGNGTKGSDYAGGAQGTKQLLNSPWDVCFDNISGKVYIAMAGQHQIWVHSTLDGTTTAFSGDGYERNLNGSSGKTTSYAQPSGISLTPDLKELYVADSESSSIRVVDLKTGGSRSLVGGDPLFPDNLFKFGDRDGRGSEVLLQHPLGVLCTNDNQVYIADSYNHKIKKIDSVNKRVTTIAGTGKAGFKDGAALAAQLSEPSGIIEAANGILFIADTNNSVIRYLDLNTANPKLLTLELKGVQPPVPKPKSLRRLQRRSSPGTVTVKVDSVPSKEGTVVLKISLPREYHFSKEARSKFVVETDPEEAVVIEPPEGFLDREGAVTMHFTTRASTLASIARISCKVYYCKEDEVCLYQSLMFEVPFQLIPGSGESPPEIPLSYTVKPKDTARDFVLPVPR